MVDGEPRIVSDPPLIVPIEELVPGTATPTRSTELVRELIRGYRRTLQTDRRVLLEQFRFVDLARKVVGVGSVGTRAGSCCCSAATATTRCSCRSRRRRRRCSRGSSGRAVRQNHGERVVAGQQLMQAAATSSSAGDARSSGSTASTRDFYVRQLQDWKGVRRGRDDDCPPRWPSTRRLCGWTLARAHARSGDRIAIAAYLGRSDAFDRAIAEFAEAYADQNERDYDTLRAAVDAGTVEAQLGL